MRNSRALLAPGGTMPFEKLEFFFHCTTLVAHLQYKDLEEKEWRIDQCDCTYTAKTGTPCQKGKVSKRRNHTNSRSIGEAMIARMVANALLNSVGWRLSSNEACEATSSLGAPTRRDGINQ